MSTIDDGGSAFPSHGSMGEVEHRGMSLRDWFAGQALGGLAHNWPASTNHYERAAKLAYAAADAMLAERSKEKP